jgi:hypothetical protein
MPMEKRAFSIPAEVSAAVDRLAAANEGGNVSAFVTKALVHEIEAETRRMALRALVAEWERENGAITDAEMDEVRRKLGWPR